MYKKLKELGIEQYIQNACGGKIRQDKYFNALEKFIESLSSENFCILRNKFKGLNNRSQIKDLLNEVAVACAFHPKACFNNNGPDFYDNGICIEIKTINESKEETERHKQDYFMAISTCLTEEAKNNEKKLIIHAIKNKVFFHLEKAKKQLAGNGLIYLIWDYDNFLHGEDNQVHPKIINEPVAQKCIRLSIEEFIKKYPNINIKIKDYFFEKLEKEVSLG